MGSTSSKPGNPSETVIPSDTTVPDDAMGQDGLRNSEEGEDLTPEQKEGFHKKLSEKDKLLKEEKTKRETAEKEAAELRERERQRKLSELTETERLQEERTALEKENWMLKINHFVLSEVNKRNLKLNDPLIEMVVRVPWEVQEVRRSLGDSPTWAEVFKAIQENLPTYLDSLDTGTRDNEETTEEEPSSSEATVPSDAERSTIPPTKRIWSRREIAKMDDATYAKHKDEIQKAMAENRIVP